MSRSDFQRNSKDFTKLKDAETQKTIFTIVNHNPPPYSFEHPKQLTIDKESIETKNHNKKTYIKLYFDFEYFTCWSPFRIRRLSNGTSEIAHANLIFLAIGITLLLVRLFREVCIIRYILLDINQTQGNAVLIKYFDLVNMLSNLCWSYVTVDSLWRRQKVFLRLHNLIQQSTVCRSLQNSVGLKFLIICVMHQAAAIFLFPISLDIPTGGDPMTLLNGLVYSGKLLFTFENKANITNHTRFSEFETRELMYGFGTLAITIFSRFQHYQGYLLLALCVLLLWESAAAFEKSWRQNALSHSEILDQYSELKDLAETINECDGRKMLVHMINLLVYLSTRFDSLFIALDWILWAGFTVEVIHSAVVIIFCCEVSRKMEGFQNWLMKRENQGLLDDTDLQWLLADLSRKTVAIRGGGLFAVDYGFLGHTMSLLVTYFIVTIQSRVPS